LITILLVVCALVLQSCGPSREQKAEAIVKREIPQILRDTSSYEPIQTVVDRAFSTIYLDTAAARAAYRLIDLKRKELAIITSYDCAICGRGRTDWSDLSEAEMEKRNQWKAEMKAERDQKLKELADEKAKQEQIIKDRDKDLAPSKFIGWLVFHTFRHNYTHETKHIETIAILVDKKMDRTLMTYNLDDDDEYGLKNLKSTIIKVTKSNIIDKNSDLLKGGYKYDKK